MPFGQQGYPNLKKHDQEKANKEREWWKYKAKYWHNAIPNIDDDMRSSLTKDVNLATNIQKLELDKKLFTGVHWNNWITVIVSIFNLILLIYNIVKL